MVPALRAYVKSIVIPVLPALKGAQRFAQFAKRDLLKHIRENLAAQFAVELQ